MPGYRPVAVESLPLILGHFDRHPCYIPDFVTPILVRPVREQLEHDRVIRLLQTKFRRRFDVGINPGAEQVAPVGIGSTAVYPDVVLMSLDRGRKVQAVIEVETVESVNHLEALAEWAAFGRLRPPFHLYIPSAMMEVAKRLCQDHSVSVAEIHSYHMVGDEFRFVPVYRAPASDTRARVAAAPQKPAASKSSGAKQAKKKKAKPAKAKKSRRPAKPARKGSGSARSQKRK